MSVLSFQAFCIEFYARHIQLPSNEVYALFKQAGVLDWLARDYDDLHGMGMEYVMGLIDDYLAGAKA